MRILSKKNTLISTLLVILLTISACGQTGPLYIPTPTKPATQKGS